MYNSVSRETIEGFKMNTGIRITDKENYTCECCGEPLTLFVVWERVPSPDFAGAYRFAPVCKANIPGHNATDAQCIAEYERFLSSA